MDNSVCIIIVFYLPDEDCFQRAASLGREFDVVVVDNTPGELRKSTDIPNVRYIPQDSNRGIARAQNIGIRYALESGVEYIMFLDQDSQVNADFVMEMLQNAEAIRTFDPQMAATGPLVYDKDTLLPYKQRITSNSSYNECSVLISSGSIVRSEVLNSVGLMEERLFIDFVDFEWCWRCRQQGWTFYMTSLVRMMHKVGRGTVKILGITFVRSVPIRYYYRTRNTFLLSRRHYVPMEWKARSAIKVILTLLLVPFIERKQCLPCYKFLLKGIIDGLRNKN